MEGDTQTSVSSTGAPTLYSRRLVVLGDLADQRDRARDHAPFRVYHGILALFYCLVDRRRPTKQPIRGSQSAQEVNRSPDRRSLPLSAIRYIRKELPKRLAALLERSHFF